MSSGQVTVYQSSSASSAIRSTRLLQLNTKLNEGYCAGDGDAHCLYVELTMEGECSGK